MSEQQRNLSPAIDPIKLDRLAEVAVKVGLRLREGQDLLLTASAVALPLVRKIAEQVQRACHQVHDADGVCETAVLRALVGKQRDAELLDAAQALKLRRIDQRDNQTIIRQ